MMSFLQGKALFDQAKHIVEESSDYEAARAKLQEAAEKFNYGPALSEYADYLYYGRGGPCDEPGSLRFYQLAAEQEDATGLYSLGYMYHYARGGVSQDLEKAKELYSKSAEKGYPSGQSYYDSVVSALEYRKHELEVVQGVIAAAEGGDIEAMYKLALYYQYGTTGLEQNNQKGLDNLRRAADGGHVPAMVELGNSYNYAQFDLQEDDGIALDWYRRAADQGDESANYKIGEFYENGCGGLEANIETAKEWYRKAGSYGQWSIDSIEAPEKNRAELKRLTEAAEAGDPDAQCQLGRVYDYSQLGVTKDEPKAVELYRTAADAGHAQAQLYLGTCYFSGRDWLQPDRDESLEAAKKYLTLSADQGNTDASYYVARYFSSKSVYSDGLFALIKGVARSKEGDGVVVDFEASGDGSYPLQAIRRVIPLCCVDACCPVHRAQNAARPSPLFSLNALTTHGTGHLSTLPIAYLPMRASPVQSVQSLIQPSPLPAAGPRLPHLCLPARRLRQRGGGLRAGRALRPHPGRRRPPGRLARVRAAGGAGGGPGPRALGVRVQALHAHRPGPARVNGPGPPLPSHDTAPALSPLRPPLCSARDRREAAHWRARCCLKTPLRASIAPGAGARQSGPPRPASASWPPPDPHLDAR